MFSSCCCLYEADCQFQPQTRVTVQLTGHNVYYACLPLLHPYVSDITKVIKLRTYSRIPYFHDNNVHDMCYLTFHAPIHSGHFYSASSSPLLLRGTPDYSTDTHSFIIHSGHFYSISSSPLLLRGTPDYSTDTVSEFHAEAHRQLQIKDLPKVPTWR